MYHTDPVNQWFFRLQEKSQQVLSVLCSYLANSPFSDIYQLLADKLGQFSAAVAKHPEQWMATQTTYYPKFQAIWAALAQFETAYPADLILERRFTSSDAWNTPYFSSIVMLYKTTVEMMLELVNNCEEFTTKEKHKIQFFLEQLLTSLSPANLPTLNPEIINETLNSRGENLLRGLDNLLHDFRHNLFELRMTDESAFQVGSNLAVTAGAVVYRDRLFELLHYTPKATTLARPLLIVPPCINKFYILDLSETNSLVKWCVEQGTQVLLMSWVNPDPSYAETSFDDYVSAILTACEFIKSHYTLPPNTLGFCIGGALLAIANAYATQLQKTLIHSCTFLTTLLDYSEPGNLGLFVDQETFPAFEKLVTRQGLIKGSQLMLCFNLLRADELLWPNIIQNYFLGKTPKAFDMLYWNSDGTNVPANMFLTYLRELYLMNSLALGQLQINQQLIDLAAITNPCYFLAAKQDHIVPWQSSWMSAQLLKNAPKMFTLTEAGHIAGVVNPPQKQKYSYQSLALLNDNLADMTQFMTETMVQAGSWWLHWHQWLQGLSGEWAASKVFTETLGPAPGEYVQRS